MEVLIGVAVFLIWYLVGLLTGLLCAGQYGGSLKYLSNKDVFVYLFISLFGPVLWVVARAYVFLEDKAGA